MVARTKKTSESTPNAEDIAREYGEIIDHATLESELQVVRSRLGIGDEIEAQVYVYQVNGDGQGHDFRVWEGDAESFNLKTIALQHGSGGYRIKVYMPDANGQRSIRISATQFIRLTASEEASVRHAKDQAERGAQPVPQSGDQLGAMREMMSGFQATIAGVLEKLAKPQTDPMLQVARVVEIIRPLMQAPAAPNPMGELQRTLEMMRALKEISGDSTAEPRGIGESLLLKAADAFMPLVRQGIAAQAEQAAQPAPGAPAAAVAALPAPGVGASEIPPAPAQSELSDEEKESLMMLQLQLKAANRAAARGGDAAEFAESIYAMIPEETLRVFAFEQGWFDILTRAVPDCATHRAWYEQVRAALIDIAVEDGLLARDAAGNLTPAIESGRTGPDQIEPAPDAGPDAPAS